MQQKGFIKKDNMIFHKYANIVTVFIDRLGFRIALSYDFEIVSESGSLSGGI